MGHNCSYCNFSDISDYVTLKSKKFIMIVGSIKENTTLEKRVSLTPESAKNIIGLGLKVCLEKGYALHLGINDSEYKDVGAEIIASSKDVLNSSDLITKVNCPSEDEIQILKDK